MSKHNVVDLTGREKMRNELTKLIRAEVHKLIGEALETEICELLSTLSDQRDEAGRAAMIGQNKTFRSGLVR